MRLPNPARPRRWLRQTYVLFLGARRKIKRWTWSVVPLGWRRPFDVVDGFDVWGYLNSLTETISEILHAHKIEHLVLPRDAEGMPRIIVRHSQRDKVHAALTADPRTTRCWLAPSGQGLVGRAAPLSRRRRLPRTADGWMVLRRLVTRQGEELVHSELGVRLEYWRRLQEDVPTAGGGTLVRGTLRARALTGVVDHATPELWRQIQLNGHRLPNAHPDLLRVTEPIDLVYTWVDGDDPAWQARKAATLDGSTVAHSADAAIDARFDNRDELKYSLRSVEMFANWVRHIWIVTDAQVPAWLRQDERLTVVDHRDIFTDPSVLPVFNSHAIESQLHHIPDLADHYLYLNDDMLFGTPVRPEDFYHSNGIGKIFLSQALIDAGGHQPDDLAVAAAAKNSRDFLVREFDRTITSKLRHSPQAQSRLLMEQFEAEHPELFATVMRSRFRSSTDYALPSSLSQYYAYAHGRAVAGSLTHGYVDLADPEAGDKLTLLLHRRHLACLCINDSGSDPGRRTAVDVSLREFFEGYYPLRSRWEKTAGQREPLRVGQDASMG